MLIQGSSDSGHQVAKERRHDDLALVVLVVRFLSDVGVRFRLERADCRRVRDWWARTRVDWRDGSAGCPLRSPGGEDPPAEPFRQAECRAQQARCVAVHAAHAPHPRAERPHGSLGSVRTQPRPCAATKY